MDKIKFSHNYPKLWNQDMGYLIEVKMIKFKDITKNLIEYDTKNSNGGYYKLTRGKLIQLFFIGDEGIPFCTIRRYTPEKFMYYFERLNTLFKIEVALVENSEQEEK